MLRGPSLLLLLTFRVSEEGTKRDRIRVISKAGQGDPEFSLFLVLEGEFEVPFSGSQPRKRPVLSLSRVTATLVGWALTGCPDVRGGCLWYQENCSVRVWGSQDMHPTPSLPASTQAGAQQSCQSGHSLPRADPHREDQAEASRAPTQAPASLAIAHIPPPAPSLALEDGHCL